MRADRIKQSLKNGVYRALGETATGVGALDGDEARTLRVLMYHKINDVPENSVTVPVGRFDEQMAQLGELGYTPVALDAVIDYYLHGTPLPPQAVLITFDDGYRDNLRNAAPVLQRYGYPAVVFVPVGYLAGTRPLPHDEHLAARGIVNPPLHWEELAELESYGVRVESHGIGHRPLADLEVDEAAREITLSKLRLEERLGRPVRAFAYVKGSEAHYRLVHLSLLKQAGYEVAFTSVSGSNGPATDPLQLHRYNVEPYPSRTFELVLAGACDLIAVKDTVAGTHARRIFNAALGTSTKVSSFELDEYRPGDRDEYVAMLGQAWGVQGLTGEEFDWWFERNPAGSLRSVARMDGKVIGASAHTLHRMVIGGEERLMGFACHAVTDPVARGLGIFTALQRHLEERAQALGSSVVLGFANPVTNRMFFGVLGWSDVAHYRIWARPARGRGEAPPPAGLAVEGDAAAGWANHVVRDTAHLAWRFLGTPRGYVPLRSPGGYAVVWPDKPYGSRAIGVVSDLAAPAKEIPGLLRRAAKVSRGRMLFALPAPEQQAAFLKAGFVPTHKTVHLIGRALNDELDHDPGAWRFTLGDADYY